MYTFLSAQYANPENTSAVVQTAEAGAIAISQEDHATDWLAMLAVIEPMAYVGPPAIPTQTREELLAKLREELAELSAKIAELS